MKLSLPVIILYFFSVTVDAREDDEAQYLELGPELSRPIAVVIVLLLFVFLIFLFFSAYLRHYLQSNATSDALVRAASVDRFGICRGLDPAVIRTFPVVAHSAIKEKSLECAVCLSEFEEHETLRLLPKCGHVFHTQCIDAWLASCATCPICRAKLAAADFVTIGVAEEADQRNGDDETSIIINGEVCEMELSGPLGDSSIGGGEKNVDVVAGGGEEGGGSLGGYGVVLVETN